jgi:acetylornithine/N-succinyldiaminopimelate aminotransferase
MRAGIETIRIMEEDGLLAHAAKMGEYFKAALTKAMNESAVGKAGLKEIRGQGLMIGMELTKPCGELTGRCAEKGLLISVTADSVIRMVPPLIITAAEIDEIVSILMPLVLELLVEKK